MNEVSAVLGDSQLKKLNVFVKKRNQIAKYYIKRLKSLPVKVQYKEKKLISSYHLMIIRLNFKKIKKNYFNIFNFLRKKKYFVNLHYYPLHLQPLFKKIGFKKACFQIQKNMQKSRYLYLFIQD